MRAPGLMRESDMDFVHAVLKTLQVVAGHLLDIPDLDEARRGPVWKMRERWWLAVAEIGSGSPCGRTVLPQPAARRTGRNGQISSRDRRSGSPHPRPSRDAAA